MKICDWRTPNLLINLLIFLAGLLLMGTAAYAQRGPTRDLSATERTLGALENESRHAKRDAQTIMAEVNDDFARLRVINDELKAVVASSATPNYKILSDQAIEIKKRGNRLKGNLAALPKGEKEEKQPKEAVPADDAQLRSLLATVNTALTSFLNNPVFSDMGTLDNQLALKARRDLEYVIDLSDVVKNGADKLSKRK
jgi:hypothetical protein